VYILTNPSFNGWVKIGMTDRNDISERLAELNRPPNLPLSFRAYALYHVENALAVEKSIHKVIDMVDYSLHARETSESGKIIREREFFHISPESAYSIFVEIAKLRGDSDSLERVDATNTELEEEEIAERVAKRPNFSFAMLDIPVGAELKYWYDESVVCTVANSRNGVWYNGELTTLSPLASKLTLERNSISEATNVNGAKYFTYCGETISDSRHRLEQAVSSDE
jgi:hypothetical protein